MHTLSYNFWLTKAAPDYFSSLIETQLDGQNLEPEVMRRCEIPLYSRSQGFAGNSGSKKRKI
uniref:Uncharacterized protein n=1 Tax=Salix viminalis TaxID=40686 RepID=A0A6N2KG43_SALVM